MPGISNIGMYNSEKMQYACRKRQKEEKTIEDYRNELKEQVEKLDRLIAFAEKRLKKEKNIKKYVVCTTMRKNGYQYYIKEEGKRKYVKSKDLDTVRDTVQKSYDESVHHVLLNQRYQIERFLKLYDITAIVRTFEKMSEARKQLVEPLVPTDEQYIEEWYDRHHGGQNTFPMQNTYMTARGEKVRSKSEKIIADLFDKYKIPYRYEPMLELESGQSVCPDFVVLNVRRRKTLYWEHFGLVSDDEYAKRTLKKMNIYEESGFIIGRDILFSMESEEAPLNTKMLERKIKDYLL